MSIVVKPSDHPDFSDKKIGILLVNLGTPDSPDTKSLRKYLKEFLSDQRVIDIPKILWWFILNFIILNTRPKKSAEAYSRIWINATGLPPLNALSISSRKNSNSSLSSIGSIKKCIVPPQTNPSCAARSSFSS